MNAKQLKRQRRQARRIGHQLIESTLKRWDEERDMVITALRNLKNRRRWRYKHLEQDFFEELRRVEEGG